MTPTDGRRGSRADELLADWADLAGRARRPMDAPTRSPGLARTVAALSAPMAFAMIVVVVVGSLHPSEPASRMAVGASPAPVDGCPVTVPNGVHSDAWPATALDHGEDGIVTALAPGGTIEIAAGASGGSGLLWRDTLFALTSPAEAPLVVSGHRWSVDYAEWKASPGIATETVEVQYPDGQADAGPLRVDLGFPGEGCWEIVAQAGPSQLRFVTRVERETDRALESCLVTRPNGAHTDAWPASELDHGEGGLYTVLWPEGTVPVPASEVDREGIGWMKFVFQREGTAEGGLRLAGRRVGAEPSDPRGVIRSQIPDGYGTTGIQATAIGFPAEGCWEVIARSGSAQLRFVTRVELTGPETADLVDGPAPSVVLERPDGTTTSAVPATGRPTIVTFWSSWCPPCVDEPALLEESSRADVDTVLVAVKDDPTEVARALSGRDLTVLLDEPGDAFARYGGFGLPLTVFIDADGVIRSIVSGPLDAATLADGLDRIQPVARFIPEPSGSPLPVSARPSSSPVS